MSLIALLSSMQDLKGRLPNAIFDGSSMNFWQNIPRPIIGLSPMDGVTDLSFALLPRSMAAPM
jgi:hypothetical protein